MMTSQIVITSPCPHNTMVTNQSTAISRRRDKLKEVEDVCQPIVSKAYGAAGGGVGGHDEEDLGDHDEL